MARCTSVQRSTSTQGLHSVSEDVAPSKYPVQATPPQGRKLHSADSAHAVASTDAADNMITSTLGGAAGGAIGGYMQNGACVL
jgi:hypothetical protein